MKVSQYRKRVQSQKPSKAMMKLALMRTTSGKEDPELPLLQRICSLVTSLRNCSPNKCFRVQVTDTSTVQRILYESGLHGQIAARKPLLKDTNKKRLAWAKKHKQWTLDLVEICPLVWWVQIWDFWFPLTQSRRTDDLCMCGSHRKTWRCDGVGVLCWWHCQWSI